MADFSTQTDTDNNPEDWFSGYVFGSGKISIPVDTLLSNLGLATTDLATATGDVRAVYLALAEALYTAYANKDGTAATTSNRLAMTKSQAVQDNSPKATAGDGTYEDIRYTTYTIHIQEKGENLAGFSVGGVRDE